MIREAHKKINNNQNNVPLQAENQEMNDHETSEIQNLDLCTIIDQLEQEDNNVDADTLQYINALSENIC